MLPGHVRSRLAVCNAFCFRPLMKLCPSYPIPSFTFVGLSQDWLDAVASAMALHEYCLSTNLSTYEEDRDCRIAMEAHDDGLLLDIADRRPPRVVNDEGRRGPTYDIVLLISKHNVIRCGQELCRSHGQPRLFHYLSLRTLLESLAILEMTTRKGPRTRTMAAFSLPQQELRSFENENTNSYTRN